MNVLALIETRIVHMSSLAEHLRSDPDGHLLRSVVELRETFETRKALEPAVARVRRAVEMIRAANRQGLRREFQRRAAGLDHFGDVVDRQLLPDLRSVGFDV